MDALNAIAKRRGLWVIEDAAEAHGATYRGRPAGSLGTLATFSFYGNKILTSGEGGAITVDDPDLESRIRLLRGQGMDPTRRYFFPIVGYNYRLTNVACAILCAQMERVHEFIARRAEIAAAYARGLARIPGIDGQPTAEYAVPATWLISIQVRADAYGLGRDALAETLATEGIETRPFFHPLHRLPPYVDRPGAARDLPVTDLVASRGLNLPTAVSMSDADVARVVDAIARARR
jgi:perosamine synthetase